MKDRIYLNNAAYHPILPQVKEKIVQLLPNLCNPSGLTTPEVAMRQEIETARENIARSLNCDTSEIVFTSGASESNSTIVESYLDFSNGRFPNISLFEHDSVLGLSWSDKECDKYKEKYTFHILVGNENGQDYSNKFQYLLYGVDATAGLGNINIDLCEPNYRMASFSAEKTGSPSGGGLLYVNNRYGDNCKIINGHQENGRRGGTENILSIVGMGISVPWAVANVDKKHDHCLKLKKTLLDELSKYHLDFICNSGDDCVPSIVSISFKRIDGIGLMTYLDTKGITVSTGSACNSGSTEPSKVLKALGVPQDYINGTLRISTSLENTEEEIVYTAQKIADYIKEVV